MNDKHTPYLKTPHVLRIINSESASCEEKLANIKNLIDGNKLKIATSGQELPSGTPATEETVSVPASSPAQSAIEKIVDEIRGAKEKQYALSFLNEIDRSNYISFNPETLEIIVDGETIKFSNVKNLVQYCINAAPSNLPIALAIFIECMIKIQLPSELLRHGDAQGLRESLIKIQELKEKSSTNVETTTSPTDATAEGPVVTNDENNDETDELGGRGKKRTREEEEGGEDATLNPPKKSYGLSGPSLDKLRTNPKLKDAIAEKWHDAMIEANPASKSKKRKATLAFPKSPEEERWDDALKEANPTSRSRKRKGTLAFEKSPEEDDDEWYDVKKSANPTVRSKKKRVTFDVQ